MDVSQFDFTRRSVYQKLDNSVYSRTLLNFVRKELILSAPQPHMLNNQLEESDMLFVKQPHTEM